MANNIQLLDALDNTIDWATVEQPTGEHRQFSVVQLYGLDGLRDIGGYIRTAEAGKIFHSTAQKGWRRFQWWEKGAGSATFTHGVVSATPVYKPSYNLAVTSSTSDSYILQSKRKFYYQAGMVQEIQLTGNMGVASANCTARLVLRSNVSGTVSDANYVDQGDWNIDTLGAGALNPSGISIEWDKTYLMQIQILWQGVAGVLFSFYIEGQLVPVHFFKLNANTLTVPYMFDAQLPVRYEIRNDLGGSLTRKRAGYFDANNGAFLEIQQAIAATSIDAICQKVVSSGGQDRSLGFNFSVNTGTTAKTAASGTRTPLLSIRPRTTLYTYNETSTLPNNIDFDFENVDITAATNPVLIEVVYGGTLSGGAGAWALAQGSTAAKSISGIEYNTDHTTINLAPGGAVKEGIIVHSFVVPSGGGGVRSSGSGIDLSKFPLSLNIDNAIDTNEPPVLTVCGAGIGGNSSVTVCLNLRELH